MKKLATILAAALIALSISVPASAAPESNTDDTAVTQSQSEESIDESSDNADSSDGESVSESSDNQDTESTASDSTETASETSTEDLSVLKYNEYKLDMVDMSVQLPDNLYVLTRDTKENDEALKACKMTKKELTEKFESTDTYIQAFSKDFTYDITVQLVQNDTTKTIDDLTLLDGDELQGVIDDLLNQNIYTGCSKTKFNDVLFLTLDTQYDSGSIKVNGIQEYTVVKGTKIVITFQTYNSPVTDTQNQLFGTIMKSVQFANLNHQTSQVSADQNLEINQLDIRYIYIIIAAAIMIIFLALMIVVGMKYHQSKKQALEEKPDSKDSEKKEPAPKTEKPKEKKSAVDKDLVQNTFEPVDDEQLDKSTKTESKPKTKPTEKAVTEVKTKPIEKTEKPVAAASVKAVQSTEKEPEPVLKKEDTKTPEIEVKPVQATTEPTEKSEPAPVAEPKKETKPTVEPEKKVAPVVQSKPVVAAESKADKKSVENQSLDEMDGIVFNAPIDEKKDTAPQKPLSAYEKRFGKNREEYPHSSAPSVQSQTSVQPTVPKDRPVSQFEKRFGKLPPVGTVANETPKPTPSTTPVQETAVAPTVAEKTAPTVAPTSPTKFEKKTSSPIKFEDKFPSTKKATSTEESKLPKFDAVQPTEKTTPTAEEKTAENKVVSTNNEKTVEKSAVIPSVKTKSEPIIEEKSVEPKAEKKAEEPKVTEEKVEPTLTKETPKTETIVEEKSVEPKTEKKVEETKPAEEQAEKSMERISDEDDESIKDGLFSKFKTKLFTPEYDQDFDDEEFVIAEPKEEAKGFWGKLKNKLKNHQTPVEKADEDFGDFTEESAKPEKAGEPTPQEKTEETPKIEKTEKESAESSDSADKGVIIQSVDNSVDEKRPENEIFHSEESEKSDEINLEIKKTADGNLVIGANGKKGEAVDFEVKDTEKIKQQEQAAKAAEEVEKKKLAEKELEEKTIFKAEPTADNKPVDHSKIELDTNKIDSAIQAAKVIGGEAVKETVKASVPTVSAPTAEEKLETKTDEKTEPKEKSKAEPKSELKSEEKVEPKAESKPVETVAETTEPKSDEKTKDSEKAEPKETEQSVAETPKKEEKAKSKSTPAEKTEKPTESKSSPAPKTENKSEPKPIVPEVSSKKEFKFERDTGIMFEHALPSKMTAPRKTPFTTIPKLESVNAEEYNKKFEELKVSESKPQTAYEKRFGGNQKFAPAQLKPIQPTPVEPKTPSFEENYANKEIFIDEHKIKNNESVASKFKKSLGKLLSSEEDNGNN